MGIHYKQMPGTKPHVFDWDDANLAHLARHSVTPGEAEQIILGVSLPLATEERSGEDRHTELGETEEGRLLLVVWTWRRRRIRVVTAFPTNRKLRALWKRIKGEGHA